MSSASARKRAARISCRTSDILSSIYFRLIHYSVFLPFIRLCFSKIEMHQNVKMQVLAPSLRITFLRAISVFVTNVRKRSFAVTTDNAVPAASKRNSTCSCVDPSMHTRTLFENLRGWWTFLIKRIRNEPISGLREGSSGPIGRCISAGGIQIRTALRLEMGHACTHGPGTHAKKIRRCRPIGARRV